MVRSDTPSRSASSPAVVNLLPAGSARFEKGGRRVGSFLTYLMV
jgi:hypothetical protein